MNKHKIRFRRLLIALGLTILTSIILIKIGDHLFDVKQNPYYHYGITFRATCALIITLAWYPIVSRFWGVRPDGSAPGIRRSGSVKDDEET